ncbi:MAG: hypothetical protein ACOY3Z_12275 [Thermodesulfobacteriota bacterium]
MHPRAVILALLTLPLLLSGCSGLLPVAKITDQSPWDTFEQAKAAYDRIIPYKTTKEELDGLGFAPYQTPNIEILNYLAIINKFMPNTNITKEDLDAGLRHCLEAKNGCVAYEMKLRKLKNQRHGNLLLDMFKFRRETQQTGWQFTAFIVLVDKTVVYKLWDGKPLIDSQTYRKNPLGPLQEPSELVTGAAMGDSI